MQLPVPNDPQPVAWPAWLRPPAPMYQYFVPVSSSTERRDSQTHASPAPSCPLIGHLAAYKNKIVGAVPSLGSPATARFDRTIALGCKVTHMSRRQDAIQTGQAYNTCHWSRETTLPTILFCTYMPARRECPLHPLRKRSTGTDGRGTGCLFFFFSFSLWVCGCVRWKRWTRMGRNHLATLGESSARSSRAALISASSYPRQFCSPAEYRRTISASF